jgi:lysophospholipase L1-like esterase
VRPLFVYIPPPFEHESDRQAHAATLARVTSELAIQPAAEHIAERLADSWIAFLRDRNLDVLDLRTVFRVHGERLYSSKDHHLNVAAHRVIADSLAPVVERLSPRNAQHVRPAPRAVSAGERTRMGSPGLPEADSILLRLHTFPDKQNFAAVEIAHSDHYEPLRLDASQAERWFAPDALHEFAPNAWLRAKPHVDLEVEPAVAPNRGWRLRTNSRGMRSDFEPAAERPDLRVLFLGNDNMVGACDANETAPNVVARLLSARHPARRIECLNAACAGQTLQNFLGVLDDCADLKPDLVVVAVDGGVDFELALRVEREARGGQDAAPATPDPRLAQVRAADAPACERFARALQCFRLHAQDIAAAVQVAADVSDELQRRCAALGADLIVLYLPPVVDVDGDPLAATALGSLAPLRLHNKDREAVQRIAHNYFVHLRQTGLEYLSLTSTFQDIEGSEFRSDYRISATGQRQIAERLALWIEHRNRWLRD